MLGPAAASRINQDGGQSVHRRTFSLEGLLVDCHVRVSDLELATGNYDEAYLNQLGSELSLIGHDAFQDVVSVLTGAVGVHIPDGPPLGGCPLYSDEKHRPGLMLALRRPSAFYLCAFRLLLCAFLPICCICAVCCCLYVFCIIIVCHIVC